MTRILFLFVIVFCTILGVSNKEISYSQNVATNDSSPARVETPNYQEYALQVGEMLNLEDASSSKINNPNNVGSATQGQLGNNAAEIDYLMGFSINLQICTHPFIITYFLLIKYI